MSLLMPEYERQLRAAARRLAGDPAAPTKPSRGGLGSRLFVGLSGAVAVAVAGAALVLIGHHGSPEDSTPEAAVPALQYDCAHHEILRTKGPLVASAHGTVSGQRWTLEVDSARHGLRSVQAGRLLLGGHAYGFCETGLDVELVNAGPHGIVYGLATRPYQPPIVIEATTAHGTAAHPVRADNYPATTRHVPEATLFLRTLPTSACAYRGLAVTAPRHATIVGASTSTLGMTGPFTHSCRPGQLLQTPQQTSGPATLEIAPSGRLSAHARTDFVAGRSEVVSTGCLACHQIGDQGNHGPGSDLTHIGRILSSRTLESALVNPSAPMPSFKSLPARSRRAIVAFLRELR
jgi:mono/diheme cytochrome c family protein